MTPPPIPFTVIGGFLGSGKTTLVNRLLSGASGQRITVLVNDFGSVAVDEALIANRDGDTITLTNGCICCSLGGELAEVMPRILAAEPRPDRVVVEASGVSEPRKIAQYGTLPGFRLDGVIVLADAEAIEDQLADPRIGHQVLGQLAQADIVLLTKVDLISAERAGDLRARLCSLVPSARVVGAPAGEVPVEVILDIAPGAGAGASPGPETEGADRGDPTHRHPAFEATTMPVEGLAGRDELLALLDGLPGEVVRAKGLVRLSGPPEEVVVVQRVGTRTRMAPTEGPVDPALLGRLVLIAVT